MKALGIHSGADLKSWTQAELAKAFGKVGNYYYKVARAEDNRPVNPNRIRKSIGAERSFYQDLQQIDEMENALDKVAEEVYQRLMKNKRNGYTLTLKIKYDNYDTVTRSQTLETPIREKEEIFRLAKGLLYAHLEKARSVRLLGITVSNLVTPQPYSQLSLEL